MPITARDFRFTHRAVRLASASAIRRALYDKVRSVRVLDAKTFRVVLREPFADWRDLYDVVLPRHALAGEDLTKVWTDRIDNPKTGAPIGSGPFLVERFERGKQLTLVRNPRYWGPHRPTSTASSSASEPDPAIRSGHSGANEVDVALTARRSARERGDRP